MNKIAWLLLMGIIAPAASLACTGFRFGEGPHNSLAQNIGWYWQVDTALVVNPRNMAKAGVPIYAAENTARWVSNFGSVTLNPNGREFPITGVNERGLMVQGLQFLRGRYPTAEESDLPSLHAFQWIQYQLDISSNLQDAIANAKFVRPSGVKPLLLHYLVCDATSACAIFEYLDGKILILEGSSLPFPALTNSSYADSLAAFRTCESNPSCLLADDSLDRFVKAVRFSKSNSPSPAIFAAQALRALRQPDTLTLWNALSQEGIFSVKGADETSWQQIELARVNFSCGQPVQMQLVNLEKSGDVSRDFEDYNPVLQERLVRQSKSFLNEGQVKMILEYSDTGTRCLD